MSHAAWTAYSSHERRLHRLAGLLVTPERFNRPDPGPFAPSGDMAARAYAGRLEGLMALAGAGMRSAEAARNFRRAFSAVR